MTTHHRHLYACASIAVLLSSGATALAVAGHYWFAALLTYGGAVAAWGVEINWRTLRAIARRQERTARPTDPLDAPGPCCPYATASNGRAHAPSCLDVEFRRLLDTVYGPDDTDPRSNAA